VPGGTVEPIRQAAVVTNGAYDERFRAPAGAVFGRSDRRK